LKSLFKHLLLHLERVPQLSDLLLGLAAEVSHLLLIFILNCIEFLLEFLNALTVLLLGVLDD
jgi:hypothetical protein